ncbi:hypothetical protein NKH95_24715 [Mesorhizobium sp. M0848]|uniref:hypothetical protein n=1 Tax=Mesorhizobium sp. M0848 TaxID=2957012 RepID=UPI00333600A8
MRQEPTIGIRILKVSNVETSRLKPQEFFETLHGFLYFHGRVLWADVQAEAISDLNRYAGLSIVKLMNSTSEGFAPRERPVGTVGGLTGVFIVALSKASFRCTRVANGRPSARME